ncbi:hypothetical protein BCV70DRAFT_196845 [Testicularia cyperi]|uniref:Uncharacterized protein n=1 Tax=Testicularia cyperi TaxID=1882483 RepID=A0A317XWH0_9BASI|nr:hypothetical protein BCV70DRAFT_196845 [Testicularia cyperi]
MPTPRSALAWMWIVLCALVLQVSKRDREKCVANSPDVTDRLCDLMTCDVVVLYHDALQATAQATSSATSAPNSAGVGSSEELCSLHQILGTESGGHPIGPLTPNRSCMGMTTASSLSINGQTLPSSGILTIFGPTASGSFTGSLPSSTASSPPSTPSSASRTATSTAPASSSTPNSARPRPAPPAPASWIARQNILILLFTTFALLAGVTYFLDELLTLLV